MSAILLSAGNASPWTGPTGNNTFLIPGRSPALVDAGVGDPMHLARLEASLGNVPLAFVLLTHGHRDHAAGLPALTAAWPTLQVVRFPEAPERMAAVDTGSTTLRPIHTPGHARDHLCFFDEACGDLFCGDLVREGGTIVVPASGGGDLRQYLESLRLDALRPRRLLPGHGPIIADPDEIIDRYLRHRSEREGQVIAALRGGATTPEQMAVRIYAGLDPSLLAAAADTLLAHLIKLQQEGRAATEHGRWRMIGPVPGD